MNQEVCLLWLELLLMGIDSFCVLRQSFCRKFQIVCEVWTPATPAFRMYAPGSARSRSSFKPRPRRRLRSDQSRPELTEDEVSIHFLSTSFNFIQLLLTSVNFSHPFSWFLMVPCHFPSFLDFPHCHSPRMSFSPANYIMGLTCQVHLVYRSSYLDFDEATRYHPHHVCFSYVFSYFLFALIFHICRTPPLPLLRILLIFETKV